MARVFIGIPTVNRPELVRETVKSALGQTFEDSRIVVTDNASKREASESVDRFVRQLADPRIRYYLQPRNEGEYGQGRFCFRECRDEEFFIFLHDDDVLAPSYVERAVRQLEENPSLAYFVANPYLMDAKGNRSPDKTRWYLSAHGRRRQPEGEIDVLSTLLNCGFTPISGTCFRTSALRDSGFVDEDCHGNYPFELNVLLRLGEQDAKAWFCPEELLGFRFHDESQRNYIGLFQNPLVVSTMILLLERRRFTGANERRRQVILGGLYRASALIRLPSGDRAGCRQEMKRALREDPWSARSWAAAVLAFIAPGLLRAIRPAPREMLCAPRYAGQDGDHRPITTGRSGHHPDQPPPAPPEPPQPAARQRVPSNDPLDELR